MDLLVRALTRKNVFAIVVGIVLAGAPLLAFDFWLSGLIDRQGQEEVETSAKRAVTLAEFRISQVIAALDGLAARGVDGCQQSDVVAMRRAAFDTTPVKEIAIVGSRGQTLCTDLGLPLGVRTINNSEPLNGANWYTLDVMQLEDGLPMVRLRRKVGAGPNEIAALVPAMLFLPQVSSHGSAFHAYAHIVTANGAVIGNIGTRPEAADAAFMAKLKSDKFGFDAEVSMPRSHVIDGHAELQWLGLFATGAIILILGVFSDADAARLAQQSGGRYRKRAAGRRIRALLPADRRYPFRPIARRRGPGALAQSPTARWCCPAPSFRSRNRAG